MTTLDSETGANSGRFSGVKFLGNRRAYWRLLIRGAALLMVTLGIYRFWLATDVRRYLWANTEIAGETLEYTGTPLELLLGFLVAVAILIPVYAGFFLAALDLGIFGKLSGVIAFAALGVLGQYAVYRARRYRLTRTIYRGLRFHQSGSAWRYALRASLWWIATGITFGLAYPFQLASLERYKMRNTFYGDLGRPFRRFGPAAVSARRADVDRDRRADRGHDRRLHRGGGLASARRCGSGWRRRCHEPDRKHQSGARQRGRVRHADGGRRRHYRRPALSGVPGADVALVVVGTSVW